MKWGQKKGQDDDTAEKTREAALMESGTMEDDTDEHTDEGEEET